MTAESIIVKADYPSEVPPAYLRPSETRLSGDPTHPQWLPEEVLAACRSGVRSLSTPGEGSVGVTSASRGEGRSTIALGTALVQRTEYERSTVLLELDFGQPSLASRLGLPGTPGLAEVLRGEVSLDACLSWPDDRLGVVVAGKVDDPVGLLYSFRRSTILEDLLDAGYVVVADLPPLPPAGRADRVVDMFLDVMLVVRAGVSSVPDVRTAIGALASPPAVILNEKSSAVPRWLRRSSGG